MTAPDVSRRPARRVLVVTLAVVVALAGIAIGVTLSTQAGARTGCKSVLFLYRSRRVRDQSAVMGVRDRPRHLRYRRDRDDDELTGQRPSGRAWRPGYHCHRSGCRWTSGRIRTQRTFRVPVGSELMVTASIRQPGPGNGNGTGYWPAFWLLGPGAWPAHGEIDILEDVNGLDQHSRVMDCGNLTERDPDGTFGPCHEPNGVGSGPQPCPGCQQGYHTYTVIVDRRDTAHQQVRWYLDGHQFFSVSESRVGAAAWQSAFGHGFAIILDLAMGGFYPDAICHCTAPATATTSGGSMSVQYVTVYQAS